MNDIRLFYAYLICTLIYFVLLVKKKKKENLEKNKQFLFKDKTARTDHLLRGINRQFYMKLILC